MAKLYEISVFVQLKDGEDYIRWSLFCKNNNFDQVTLKTMTGVNSVQQLLTKWCRRFSLEDTINYSQVIINRTQENGFDVIRSRISTHWSDSELDGYYECNFNIRLRGSNDFDRLCSTLQDEQGVSIGSLHECIGVTVRPTTDTLEDAIAFKDRIINRLKSQDLHISGCIKESKVLFDTNFELDAERFS